jgi:hypothetical protein
VLPPTVASSPGRFAAPRVNFISPQSVYRCAAACARVHVPHPTTPRACRCCPLRSALHSSIGRTRCGGLACREARGAARGSRHNQNLSARKGSGTDSSGHHRDKRQGTVPHRVVMVLATVAARGRPDCLQTPVHGHSCSRTGGQAPCSSREGAVAPRAAVRGKAPGGAPDSQASVMQCPGVNDARGTRTQSALLHASGRARRLI